MAVDPTGYAGPHPDLRAQICDMANMLVERSREDGHDFNWPSRSFTGEDLTILGQRTWNDITTINHVISGGGFSAALVSAGVEGRRYGGLVTAGRKPDSGSWGLMSAGFGEQPEGRSISGDTGGGGHHCIGIYGTSSGAVKDVQAVEIEYFDGVVHRVERGADNCTIVFAPAENWDQVNSEVTVRYLDSTDTVVEGYSMTFGTGWRPPDVTD